MTQPLYRNMTADQLRLQYNPSRSMPEAPQLFQGWKDRSAAFRAAAKGELDIAYGEHPAARFDLFLPEAPSPRLHVYIHGGYWQAFGKSDFSFMAEGLTRAGMAVAVLGYPLCPTVAIPGIIRHALSPFGLRSAGKARLLLCTGGQESDEFKRQTSVLGRLWARQGSNLEVITFPMRNHFTILDELALPDSALARRCLEMLEA